MTVRPAGIEVLAYLPPPLLGHLRVVLAGSSAHVLRVADRWETFADAIRSTTADVVVADPCADGVRRGVSLAALLESRPTLPLVVYTPVAPPSFQAIAELARLCAHYAVHQVVLYRYDDEPRRFLELLEQQPGSSMSAALLERIAPAIDALPATLARAVDRLIRRPTEFEDVADLARVARVTVRTAYRHLAGAGFVSPRALIVAARLLHAYAYARDPRQSLESIATRVGYSAPRMLTKHMREVLGATPRAVRRQMRPADFLAALTQWLIPTPVPDALLASSWLRYGVPLGDAAPRLAPEPPEYERERVGNEVADDVTDEVADEAPDFEPQRAVGRVRLGRQPIMTWAAVRGTALEREEP